MLGHMPRGLLWVLLLYMMIAGAVKQMLAC